MQDRYTPNKPIHCDHLFNGQLAPFGIVELQTPESSPSKRALTDGIAVLWIHRQPDGTVLAMSDECTDTSRILSAIENCFAITWGMDENVEDADPSSLSYSS